MKAKLFLLLLSCAAALTMHAQVKIIPFGEGNQIQYDLDRGTYNVVVSGRTVIKDAYAVCRSGDLSDSSTAYTFRRWSADTVWGSFIYTVSLFSDKLPEMQQVFIVRGGEKSIYEAVGLMIAGCDYMSPLTTSHIDLHEQGDNRALLVPFDNDAWVRYNAFPLSVADFTGSEVTAIYNNTSRHGLVMGSVDHEEWKSGVRVKGSNGGKLSFLSMFAGYTDKTYTHDTKRHGLVKAGTDGFTGSPLMMIGWFDDWRIGLETYGKSNAEMGSRYIFQWTKATPFGWNSWGAMQDKLTLSRAKTVVDFFHDSCGVFRTVDSTLYIDLDSYWDLLLKGGIQGDYSQLTAFCDYCKSKGFQPGIYWAPFVDWGKSERKMEGSDYNYQDCWTRQNGQFIDLDGARALDPTHPGTRARIALVIGRFKECGFKMIKIDFLGHATLEADHFYDTTVHTGMQAFRKGMEYLVGQLDGKMLVYAAISPNLATARYAHMRRIACDAYSGINETAYTLNSVTYGWWQGRMYDHIDADHIVFKREPAGMNRARLASALVTGTLIMGDDYSIPGQWDPTARALLQNKDLLEIARHGRAFRPVEGNTGDRPGNFFISRTGKHTYLAIFNYSDTSMTYTIDAGRWGIPKRPLKELFSGRTVKAAAWTVSIPPADAAIYRVE
jgi:alpha-galactosidase